MLTPGRGRPARAALLMTLLVAPPAAADETTELPANPTLPDFLRVAEARNPLLRATRSLWRAEAEGVDAAGSFPDPHVAFAWYVQEVETRVGPQKAAVRVRQPLPWFGKLGLSQGAAEQGARAAHARYADRRLELRRDVTLAWFDLYWLGRATAVTAENLDLLIDLERIIRERYRLGRVAHADLIRLQVEMGVVENHLRSLEDRRSPAIARMNALLHRPESTEIPSPSRLPEASAAPESVPVFDAVRRGSPRLEERARRLAQAESARHLAGRSRWPDWMVGADWIRTDPALNPTIADSGKDAFILSVSVDLPIFRGKWDAPARAAEERYVAARARRDFEEDELLARADEVLFEWRDADRRLNLYRGALLPKARESYAALDAAYRTGQGAFLDLIEAQRTLLQFELERERALTDRGRSVAQLQYLTGGYDGREDPK